MTLEGVQFVTDASGKRTAVMLDLDRYGELWEDIYDIPVSYTHLTLPTSDLV